MTNKFDDNGPADDEPDVQLWPTDMPYASEALNLRLGRIQPTDPRKELRIPSFIKYPSASRTFRIEQGVDLVEQEIGFQARALDVYSFNDQGDLFVREIQTYVSHESYRRFNLPSAVSRLSFEWHSGISIPGGVPVAPEFYVLVHVYDEWIP